MASDLVDDIGNFLASHQKRERDHQSGGYPAPSGPPHRTGHRRGSEARGPPEEPRLHRTPTQQSTSSTSTTASSSLFSRHSTASTARSSISSATGFSAEAATVFEDEEQDMAATYPETFPCELGSYGLCDAVFQVGQFDEWLEHQGGHYPAYQIPPRACCWFCETVFDASLNPIAMGDTWVNFRDRMAHIYQHIYYGGFTNIRVDHLLADHLMDIGFLEAPNHLAIRRYVDEIPKPDGEFMPVHRFPGSGLRRRDQLPEARRRERDHGWQPEQVVYTQSREERQSERRAGRSSKHGRRY